MISVKKSTAKGFCYAGLICSVFPILSYLLEAFPISLTWGMQNALAGMNILCALLGLGFSIACVKRRETRNVVTIISTILSAFWLLLIAGCLALALILSFVR